MLHFVFPETEAMTSLSAIASSRLHQAFRPKTRSAYSSMFKICVAVCIFCQCQLSSVDTKVILSFLECLVHNNCSVCMIENYVSAIKANFVLYDLPCTVLEHPKIKYFITLKITRPMSLRSHNIIIIKKLADISAASSNISFGIVYRAIFLMGFFAFLRLSNLAPHAIASFDFTRHLTGEDIFFTKKFVKVLIKWSKTNQTRDKVQYITLPKLKNALLCPHKALKSLYKLYPMSSSTSLFQIKTAQGWIPLTDSRVRKALKSINVVLGLNPSYHTFHNFRWSGATFAHASHVPIQDIKHHGTWSSDYVWKYIYSDHSSGENLASTLAPTINAL